MDSICRLWEISSELKFILGTRTERGKARLFKHDVEDNKENPVNAYKKALSELSDNLSDVKTKPA